MDGTTLLLTFAPVVIIGLVIYFMLRASKQGSTDLSAHPHEVNQEMRIKQLEDRISELEKRSK